MSVTPALFYHNPSTFRRPGEKNQAEFPPGLFLSALFRRGRRFLSFAVSACPLPRILTTGVNTMSKMITAHPWMNVSVTFRISCLQGGSLRRQTDAFLRHSSYDNSICTTIRFV